MYLSTDTSTIGSLLSFAPQLTLTVFLGALFSHDLPFAWFLQTFAFVALNKVCTSQWYLNFLPLVLPQTTLTSKSYKLGIILLICWIAGQGLWLYNAFQLEHMGQNTFFNLWVAGIVFFFSQIAIICGFIQTYVNV
ncbi:GPI mannosyltransferase 1 [Globomyces sp. JEL0801]|nr:GPI mannosyltransferase 1 [Globomyces sp. JEL0801]